MQPHPTKPGVMVHLCQTFEKLRACRTRVARFFLVVQTYQNRKNRSIFHYTNGRKIPNARKIYQRIPFQNRPKYTEIGIFGLIIYHLATQLLRKPSLPCVYIHKQEPVHKNVPTRVARFFLVQTYQNGKNIANDTHYTYCHKI
jgi:hypothetical protein